MNTSEQEINPQEPGGEKEHFETTVIPSQDNIFDNVKAVETNNGDQIEVGSFISPTDTQAQIHEKLAETEQRQWDNDSFQSLDLHARGEKADTIITQTKYEANIRKKALQIVEDELQMKMPVLDADTIDSQYYIEGRVGELNFGISESDGKKLIQEFAGKGYTVIERPDVGFLVKLDARSDHSKEFGFFVVKSMETKSNNLI